MIERIINYIFGEIDVKKVKEVFLILSFFISLFSGTCFFFDAHQFTYGHTSVHFPVGLIFFPATFVISNIIQYKYSKKIANTVVACSFFADLLLVSMCWFVAHIGDRMDYWTVFKDLPLIMGFTFIFLFVSSTINTVIFEKYKSLGQKSMFGLFISFLTSTTAAEIAVSSMSMPLLFYKQGFTTNVFTTIFITVGYKILFNIVSSALYVLVSSRKETEKLGGSYLA